MIQDTGWFKSSVSGAADDHCVEVRMVAAGSVGVRDSKDPGEGALWVGSGAWAAFVDVARASNSVA